MKIVPIAVILLFSVTGNFATTLPPEITTLPPWITSMPENVPDEDSETIDFCIKNVMECPWSIDRLAEEIAEREHASMEDFSGEGEPAIPTVDPNSVPDEILGATGGPGGGSRVPENCLKFGEKHWSNSQHTYIIDCSAYLKDKAIKYYYQRRNAMVGCFKCRNLCQQARYL